MGVPLDFVSKLTDSDGENSETDTWLDFAEDCGYLKEGEHERPREKCRSVGRMLGSMFTPLNVCSCGAKRIYLGLRDPGKFLPKPDI